MSGGADTASKHSEVVGWAFFNSLHYPQQATNLPLLLCSQVFRHWVCHDYLYYNPTLTLIYVDCCFIQMGRKRRIFRRLWSNYCCFTVAPPHISDAILQLHRVSFMYNSCPFSAQSRLHFLCPPPPHQDTSEPNLWSPPTIILTVASLISIPSCFPLHLQLHVRSFISR